MELRLLLLLLLLKHQLSTNCTEIKYSFVSYYIVLRKSFIENSNKGQHNFGKIHFPTGPCKGSTVVTKTVRKDSMAGFIHSSDILAQRFGPRHWIQAQKDF